jgi:spore maturation protein CgeB
MNILVIGEHRLGGFATHISDTFERMGHSAHRYKIWGTGPDDNSGVYIKYWNKAKARLHRIGEEIGAYRRWWRKPLWQLLETYNIDLTVVCHDSFLWPEQVERVQRCTSGPVVLWFPDSIGNLNRGYCVTAPYDVLFFKDSFIVEQLQDLCQGDVYYLPECMNPDKHRFPSDDTEEVPDSYRCEVTTAGNLHSYRVALFKQLMTYDVKIWGNPPARWLNAGPVKEVFQNRYVAYEEKALAFRGAKIVLNNLHPTEVWGVNVRTFEAAGIGAFQLVTWRPGLDQLFSVGNEIVAYRGIDDLKKKIDYYLNHDAEREEIATKSKERAMAEHTYRDRLDLMIDTIRGSEDGYRVTYGWG